MTVTTLKKAPKAATALGLPVQLMQLENELNLSYYERRDPIRTILITLLAAQNGFILGPPGTAKSELLETICSSFVGAKYWRILMDRQMGKEDSVGAIDITKYLAGGGWGRDITDTFADAHIALLDEVGNTGPAVMNAFLTIMNEKMFKPNGHWIKVPLISSFGASNYWLEDMPAMWDRFLVRFTVDYIVEDESFAALYDRASGAITAPQITTKIDLADLQHAITVDVPKVVIPAGVRDSIRELRTDLRAEQIILSDRRWTQTAPLIKASAFLNGRSQADEDDLQVLQHVLWEVPDHAKTVHRKVMSMTSPTTRVAMQFAAELDSLAAEVDSRQGQAVEDRAGFGGHAHFQMSEIQTKLAEEIKTATEKGRSTVQLEAVDSQIRALRTKVYIECMNVDPARAALMP